MSGLLRRLVEQRAGAASPAIRPAARMRYAAPLELQPADDPPLPRAAASQPEWEPEWEPDASSPHSHSIPPSLLATAPGVVEGAASSPAASMELPDDSTRPPGQRASVRAAASSGLGDRSRDGVPRMDDGGDSRRAGSVDVGVDPTAGFATRRSEAPGPSDPEARRRDVKLTAAEEPRPGNDPPDAATARAVPGEAESFRAPDRLIRPSPFVPASDFTPARDVRGGDLGATRAEPTEVHVTIGSIEVTAVHAPAPAARPKRKGRSPMSLDEYLARREEKSV